MTAKQEPISIRGCRCTTRQPQPARKPILSDWIDRAELARELNVTADSLARWATAGIGPPQVKVGRRVMYRRASVEKWLADLEGRNGNG